MQLRYFSSNTNIYQCCLITLLNKDLLIWMHSLNNEACRLTTISCSFLYTCNINYNKYVCWIFFLVNIIVSRSKLVYLMHFLQISYWYWSNWVNSHLSWHYDIIDLRCIITSTFCCAQNRWYVYSWYNSQCSHKNTTSQFTTIETAVSMSPISVPLLC